MDREGGVPSQVDRSYLSHLPGSTQAQLIASMRWLGLIEPDLKPTETLVHLVECDDPGRKDGVKAVLETRYPGAADLPVLATQRQLEDAFGEMGVNGSTRRKAIAFYLAGARYADMTLSRHFSTPRASRRGAGERRSRRRGRGLSDDLAEFRGAEELARAEPSLHPLIHGLVQELPPPGSPFPAAKQRDWLEAAQAALRLIYNAGEADPDATSDRLRPSS